MSSQKVWSYRGWSITKEGEGDARLFVGTKSDGTVIKLKGPFANRQLLEAIDVAETGSVKMPQEEFNTAAFHPLECTCSLCSRYWMLLGATKTDDGWSFPPHKTADTLKETK